MWEMWWEMENNMKRKDILREKFEEFLNENSSIVMQTDSEVTDMYDKEIGIMVLAIRLHKIAVLIE